MYNNNNNNDICFGQIFKCAYTYSMKKGAKLLYINASTDTVK